MLLCAPHLYPRGRAFLVSHREVDNAAFGPVWLRDARVARVVADALLTERAEGIFISSDLSAPSLGDHAQSGACAAAAQDRPTGDYALVERIHRAKSQPGPGPNGGAFWHDESFDHRVRDEAELDRIVHYVEYHQVSASLAANPREWNWSSARSAGESACPAIGVNPREM
jgi:putative transposase